MSWYGAPDLPLFTHRTTAVIEPHQALAFKERRAFIRTVVDQMKILLEVLANTPERLAEILTILETLNTKEMTWWVTDKRMPDRAKSGAGQPDKRGVPVSPLLTPCLWAVRSDRAGNHHRPYQVTQRLE